MSDANRLLSLLNFATDGDLLIPPQGTVDAQDLQTGLDLYSGIQAVSRIPDIGQGEGIGPVAFAATGGRLRPMGRRRGF